VNGPSQQASATAILQGAGADLDQVEFITYTTNTVWIRDYGPASSPRRPAAIVDHVYNGRGRSTTRSGVPERLWGEPRYDLP